jgi:phosphatidylglycerol:prolipoprotein diacylglycerol transferase
MYPILLRVGSFTLYSYTVALVAGIALGTWMTYQRARAHLSPAQAGTDPGIVLDVGFWALLGGLVGARVAYVAANWAYYGDHIAKAVNISEGGLTWHGALIGGTLALALWVTARRQRDPSTPKLRSLLDIAAPGLALGGALGWLGALLTGSAYGAEAGGCAPPLAWLTARLPDIYGVVALRFMTQPAMIVTCLLILGLTWALGRRLYLHPGLPFALYLGLYALSAFLLWFLRGDGTWRRGLWLWQWMSLVEFCTAAGLSVYAVVGSRQRGKT